jgi:sigma-B regulation protein RsbU (phosphoserine phosphatase)
MKNSYPLHTPSVGLEYYGECRPAREASWDFYEFIPAEERSLVCSLGRIHGQGVSAALTMVSLQAFLRSLTRSHRGSFADLVEDLNRTVYEIAPDSFYASLFYAWIDPERSRLHYVSAGHGPALLIRTGQPRVLRLENTGTVLGLGPRVEFRQRAAPLQSGDLLLAMTDGVADVLPESEVLEIVDGCTGARPVDLVRQILDAARGSEDRTAVAVRVRGRAAKEMFELRAEESMACVA